MRSWIGEALEPSLLMSFLQVTLGTAIAADDGFFNLPFYALTIVGVGLAQNAVNVLNDYYDCRTGVDARTMKTPFSGVVSSLIKPEAAFTFGITSERMILGLGTGFLPRLDQMGISHAEPVGRLEESIDIVRRLLRGEVVGFQGRHYSLRDVKPFFPKFEHPIPIYLAGWKKQMIKLAGRMADGYLARATESIQSLRALSDGLTRACSSGGRDPSAFGKAAYVLCSVKKKSEKAKHAMRNNPFAIYQFAVMENYVLSQTSFDPEIRKRIAEPYSKGDLPEASKQVTDELLDAFTAAGNEDEVVARINDYAQIALPILQPIGVDSEGMRMVLEAGRSFLGS